MIENIALIGAGNLAVSLVKGFIQHQIPAKNIWVSNPSKDKLQKLQQEFNVHVETNNSVIAQHANVIILSVKPNVIPTVITELSSLDLSHRLIISVAAGVTIAQLRQTLGAEAALIRAMPNIGAQYGLSATSLFASLVSAQQQQLSEQLFRAVGDVIWLESEAHIDAATALAGSGPAYVFYIMEAMQQAGQKIELPQHISDKLILQTFKAAIHLAANRIDDLSTLRREVTSPGGTTAAAIESLESQQFQQILIDAIEAAYSRAQAIAKGE